MTNVSKLKCTIFTRVCLWNKRHFVQNYENDISVLFVLFISSPVNMTHQTIIIVLYTDRFSYKNFTCEIEICVLQAWKRYKISLENSGLNSKTNKHTLFNISQPRAASKRMKFTIFSYLSTFLKHLLPQSSKDFLIAAGGAESDKKKAASIIFSSQKHY